MKAPDVAMTEQPRPEPAPNQCLTGIAPRDAGAFANEVHAAVAVLLARVGKLQLAYEGELHRTGVYTPPAAQQPPDSPAPLFGARERFWKAVKDIQRLVLGPPLPPHPGPDAARSARSRARALLTQALTESADWSALEVAVHAASGLFVRARIAEERPACPCMERDEAGGIVHRGCWLSDTPRLPTAEERTQDIFHAWKVTEGSLSRTRGELTVAMSELRPLRQAAEAVHTAWAKGPPGRDELSKAIGHLCALLPRRGLAAADGAP